MLKISIVIPTLNEENYLGLILKDLEKQTLKPYQVIVIDGNSKDETAKIARKFRAKLIKTGRGVGLQRTAGAKIAAGDLVYFFDADVRINKNFLHDTSATFIKNNLDIAIPLYVPFKSTVPIRLIYQFFNILFFITQHLTPSGAGSGIIVKNTIFKKAGYFKHDLTYDDIEFIRRVASRHKFGIIKETLFVSDRRFRKYGVVKMLALYLILSLFFLTGQFRLANFIKYSFGSFSNTVMKNT